MPFDKGYAVLVGVGAYQNPQLAAEVTAADAQALAAVLQDPRAAGYPAAQVTLLTNAQASRAGVLAALQDVAARAPADSSVVVFLCGHGIPTPDQKSYYFLPYDTQPSPFGGFQPATVISGDELVRAIGAIQAQKVLVIFNTCFSGVMAGALDAGQAPTTPPPADMVNQVLSAGQGRVVLSACKRDQKSWYNASAGHTLFVQHLLDGLSGSAGISNGRGYIGLFELYEYVYDKVHGGIRQLNPNVDQQPEITIHEGVGPFPVALYQGGQGVPAGSLDPAGLKPAPTQGAVETRPAIQAGRDVIQAGRDVNQASGGGFVNTGQTGNVQTGSGTQWNIGAVSAGRNANFGSTINEQQTGGVRFGDNATVRQQWGDTVGGDQITAGDISGTGVAIGRGAQANVTRSGADAEALARAFAVILQQVQARPADPNVEKQEIVEKVQQVQQEVAKGEAANPSKVERWLRDLVNMAPDIGEVVAATLASPAIGIATVIRKIGEKARATQPGGPQSTSP